jgi:hypothetical protein
MPIITATVMNYKDEDIERFEENNSQNNGELLKEKQVKYLIYLINFEFEILNWFFYFIE